MKKKYREIGEKSSTALRVFKVSVEFICRLYGALVMVQLESEEYGETR